MTVASTFALACAGFVALSPVQASASSSTQCSLPAGSAPNTPDTGFGTNVPVILVHGAFGSPADWETQNGSSICDNVDALPGVRVVLNYRFTGLDTTRVAGDLAPFISQIANQSAANGGPGKVDVVSYGLGTVITRKAAASGDVGSQIGQVVTIGAENLLSYSVGYPSGVAVRAVAGDIVTNVNMPPYGTVTTNTHSDGVVPERVALKLYTDDQAGGKVVLQCTETFTWSWRSGLQKSTPFNDLCEHWNLLKNAEVLGEVSSGITAYVGSLPPVPTPTPTETGPVPPNPTDTAPVPPPAPTATN